MTIAEIEIIISHWGSEPARPVRPILEERWSGDSKSGSEFSDGGRALRENPGLGWAFAKRIVIGGRTYPLVKKKNRFHRVSAAIALLLAEQRGGAPASEALVVSQARELDGSPSVRPVLRAALLAVDATLELVATSLKLSVEVVDAYQDLFFNVLDRKDDFEYISKLVGGDNSPSVAFAREQAKVSATDPLLAVARIGTVQDVMVAAGLSNAEELSSAAVSETLRRNALSAAIAWFADPGNQNKAPSQLVALGLDLVKRMSQQPDQAETADASSGMGAFFASQFESDGTNIRGGMDDLVLESIRQSS